jgi:uncharacterized membrane protein
MKKSKTRPNLGDVERGLSLAGGAALLIWALVRFSRWKAIPALGSAYLLYRGISGRDPVYRKMGIVRRDGRGIEVTQAITIGMSREELYRFWRRLENLPTVMSHLEEVLPLDETRSRWRVKAPLGMSVEWEAQITEDRPFELISWRSLPDSQIRTEGTVRFTDAPDGRGCEVHVRLSYQPPFGSAGAALARLWGEEPRLQVRDDLRRLKQLLETGQVPSTRGQSSGRLRQVEHERSGPSAGAALEADK